MAMADRLREILKREYGINTLDELQEAVEKQQAVDIGLFTTAEQEGKDNVQPAC